VLIGAVVARAVVSGQSRIVAATTIDTAGVVTASGGSPEDATAAIEAVAPPLAELLRLMRPRSPAEFWTTGRRLADGTANGLDARSGSGTLGAGDRTAHRSGS